MSPEGKAKVVAIGELIEAWRDLDWMFEREPMVNYEDPAPRYCELADLRYAKWREIGAAVGELVEKLERANEQNQWCHDNHFQGWPNAEVTP